MQHKSAHTRDRPEYPQFREKFGLDPARFIFTEMDLAPLLRGIDDVDLLRAFQTVEADRDDPDAELIADITARIQRLQDQADDDDSQPASAVATDGGVDR